MPIKLEVPHFVLTALPNGFVSERNESVRMSVLLTPQLATGVGASECINWPTRLLQAYGRKGFSLSVRVGGFEPFSIQVNLFAEPSGEAVVSERDWGLLFDGVCSVSDRSRGGSLAGAAVRSLTHEAREVNTRTYQDLTQRYAVAAATAVLARGSGREERLSPHASEIASAISHYDIYVGPQAGAAAWAAQDAVLAQLQMALDAADAAYFSLQRDYARLDPPAGKRVRAEVMILLYAEHKSTVDKANANATAEIDKAKQVYRTATNSDLNPQRYEAAYRWALQYPRRGRETPRFAAQGARQRPDVVIDQFEFHRILARLSNHPALLPRLGLVFDISFQAPWNIVEDFVGDVSVIATDGDAPAKLAGIATYTTRTAFEYRAGDRTRRRFVAMGRPNELDQPPLSSISRGLLNVQDNGVFTLDAMDHAGTAIKLARRAETPGDPLLAPGGIPEARTSDQGVTYDPPTVQTTGIGLRFVDPSAPVRLALRDGGRAARLQAKLEAAQAAPHDTNLTPLLYAEDIVLGYRVDVWARRNDKDPGRYYSLCERDGGYIFLGSGRRPAGRWRPSDKDALGKMRIEGFIQHSSSRAHDDRALLEPPDTLLRWENWSLVVPPPDRPINAVPDKQQDKPLRVRGRFQVRPESLPPLRFGAQYWVRCRVVDLAGNSLARQDCADDDHSQSAGLPVAKAPEAFEYKRFEPIRPPVILLHERLQPGHRPGEQMDRLVIHGEHSEVCRRWIVPPRVTEAVAELHGQFDHYRSDEGAFMDTRLTRSGSFVVVGELIGMDRKDITDPVLNNAILAFERNAPNPECPYFPDPLARSAKLDFYDGRGAWVCCVMVDFYPQRRWPHAQPVLLTMRRAKAQRRCVEVSKRSLWISGRWTTEVVVNVGRYEVVSVRVSCPPAKLLPPVNVPAAPRGRSTQDIATAASDRDPIDLLGLWSLRATGAGAAITRTEAMLQAVREGAHELISPGHLLTLVHAMSAPPRIRFASFDATRRRVGDTGSAIQAIVVAAGTAGKGERPEDDLWKGVAAIEVNADWNDSVDDEREPGPTVRPRTATPLHQKLVRSEFPTAQPIYAIHELSDTKRHDITYRLAAVSAHAEYYSDTGRDNAGQPTEERSWVLASSARPHSPDVAYAIPAFRWARRSIDDPRARGLHHRRAGGIRVYLRRPWFSSGNEEKLALVLRPPEVDEAAVKAWAVAVGRPEQGARELLGRTTTQWGADPIRSGAVLKQGPLAEHFRSAIDIVTGRHLAELATSEDGRVHRGVPVTAVIFEPCYDAERRLWFCDIEVDPSGAYFPFVRLALARYQRGSLADCELSEVVLADVQQVVPHRDVVVIRPRGKDRLVDLNVEGGTYQATIDPAEKGSRMRFSLEKRRLFAHGLSAWTPVKKTPGKSDVDVTVDPKFTAPGLARWTHQMTLPARGIGTDYRVVVRELERYQADLKDSLAGAQIVERVVFATAVEV